MVATLDYTGRMRPWRLLLLAIVLILGIWLALTPPNPGTLPLHLGPGAAPVHTAPAGATPNDTSTAQQGLQRDQPGTPEAPKETPLVAIGTVTIRGHCVRAEDGQAAADARLTATVEEREVANGKTAADGTFELQIPFDDTCGISLAITAAGRIERRSSFERLVAGTIEELGTIPLQRGFAVRGHVRHSDGSPVPDLALVLGGIQDTFPGQNAPRGTADARTAVDGSFELSPLVPAGRWQLRSMTDAAQATSWDFAFDEHSGPPTLELVVTQRSIIRGQVETAEGTPVAQLEVQTSDGLATATTQRDGTFQLVARGMLRGSTTVRLADQAAWPAAVPAVAEWDGAPVVLRLPHPPPPLRVLVRDETGIAITGFQWSLTPTGTTGRLLPMAQHPDGELTLSATQYGTHVLRIVPASRELLTSDPIELAIGAKPQPPVTVVLQQLISVAVEVIDSAGQPQPATMVQLFRNFVEANRHQQPQDLRSGVLWATPERTNEQVDSGNTDATGRITLWSPRNGQGLQLRVKTSNHPLLVVDAAMLPTNRLQRVIVPRGGRIHGRLSLHRELREQLW